MLEGLFSFVYRNTTVSMKFMGRIQVDEMFFKTRFWIMAGKN
jgi:hypothetical protein